MSEKETNPQGKEPLADLSSMLGMGGLMEGVSSLISKFGELAERGESLHKSMGETSTGKPYQSSMGFSVKFGPGNTRGDSDATHVAPMNTTSQPKSSSTATNTSTATATAAKLREPSVDMFEEDDHLLLVAEMPGVEAAAIQLQFDDKKLKLEGKSKTTVFMKEMELPRVYTPEQVSVSAHNGVVEIRLNNQ